MKYQTADEQGMRVAPTLDIKSTTVIITMKMKKKGDDSVGNDV